MIHERSCLSNVNKGKGVTRWKLDEREGPLRMKTKLKRHHSFYDEYGFKNTKNKKKNVELLKQMKNKQEDNNNNNNNNNNNDDDDDDNNNNKPH